MLICAARGLTTGHAQWGQTADENERGCGDTSLTDETACKNNS